MVTQTHHFRVLQTNSTRFFKQISTINSMIFKTMDNELKVFGKTILTTTEHLKNLETVNATVYNKNGQFNLQGLSINTSQSVGNFTKLNNAFKSYNGNLTKSTQLQNAYIKAVGNQNGALGNYLAGLNGAKASMGGYIKSLIGAKAATIGLQVASTLLNAALSLGLSLALSAIVSGITHLVNKEKEAREQAIENAQTAKEEADNLTELLNKYNQLSEEVKTNTGVKDDLLETQGELLESLGIEQSQLDGLIKKYGDLNTAINKVTLDSLNDAQADLMVAVDARKKELINVGKDYKHWFSLTDRNLISTGGEESKQAYDILAKAGVISQGSVGTGGGVFTLVGDDKTVDGILENYQKLKEAQTALNEAVSNGEISKEDMGSNPLYKAINSRLDELKTAVDNYNSAIKDVNENSANQEIISNLIGKDLPQTEEEFETFKQSLIDSAQASNNFIGSQEDIKNSIIDALAEMPEFEKYFEGLAQAESDVQHETPTSFEIPDAETLKQQISDLNSAIDSIQSAYDTLNSAVEEYNSNGGQLSIDTIQSLLSLSDEYLACLQVENGQLSLNADAMAQLAQAKLDDAQATAVTQAMTELQAIANGEAAQSTANYITGNAALMDSLAQLSGSYEGVAQAAMTAAQAQELSAQISAASAKDKTATENVMKGLDTKLKLIQSTKNAISAGNFASVSKKTSKSGSSSKSSKDELKEQFQVEYNLLKHNLEMETITEKEYYDGVQALNEKYFAGKEEYLDEYRKYEEEVYKGLKSYYKSYCDDMMDYWDKALAANKMSLKQFVNDAKALFDKLHNAGNLSDEDYWNYMSDYYQKQIDYMDKVVSAVDKVIDDEIDKLEDQKSKVESYYQNQIDLLNKQKEALEKANEARQKAIDLQKKQYELERAKNQRSDLMYKDNQFVYVANDQNIRDKQSDLDDAQYQMKIQEIENQISSLEDKMDELTGNIDKQIDDLNAYKDQWDSVAEQFGYAQDQIIASEVLGQGYEEEILAMRQDILDNFTNSYIDLQQNQVNAAWAAANSIIESINAQITALNALKEAQGIAGSSPLASTSGSAVNVRDSAGVSENSSNEKNNKSQKNGDYWTYKNLGSFNTSGEASSQIGMLGGDSVISVGGRYAVVKWIRGYKTAKIAHQRMSSENASGFYRRYASGTDNAEKGWHIVSEDNIGDEIVIDNNGNAVIPHGEQLYNFQGGEQVIPANESKEIIENQGNVEKIPTKVVLGDGTVLTPVSHVMEISDSIRQSMMKNVALPNNIGQRNYENLMKNANNISNVNNNQPTDNSISIGEIHLHEVQNVDALSKAIIHKFPGKMRQALYSR